MSQFDIVVDGLRVLDRSHDETAELAAKVLELSPTLCEQWLTADYAAKCRILDIVCLNCRLDCASLCPTMRIVQKESIAPQ